MPINYDTAKTLIKGLVQKMKSFRGNWNQNDPTADDYIKNRPFYTEQAEIVILPETTINGEGSVNIKAPLIVGQEYKITWNGVVYRSIARDYSGYRMIGNNAVYEYDNGIGYNTGEPFAAETNGDNLSLSLYIDDTVAEPPTVSITTFGEVVHKIDEKYIPDIFAHKDDIIYNTKDVSFGQVLVASNFDNTNMPVWMPWNVFNSDGKLLTSLFPNGYPTVDNYNRLQVSELSFVNLPDSNNFDTTLLTSSVHIDAIKNYAGVSLFLTGTTNDTPTQVPGDKLRIYLPDDYDTKPTRISAYKKLQLSAFAAGNVSNDIHLHTINDHPVVTFAQGYLDNDGMPFDDVQIRLRNVETPLEDYDAVNKTYVDSSFDIVNDIIYLDNFSATPTVKDGKNYATYTVLDSSANVLLTPNTKYHVIFQNTHYDCVSYITKDNNGLPYIVIGSGEFFGGSGGNGEPFAFSQLYDSIGTFFNPVTLMTQSAGTYNVSLTKTGYKQILEKYVPTTIPAISTATVGQTIVVKAVDDTGKPTEWEAVDMNVLTSPNGTKFKITVADDGTLSTTAVTA